MPTTAPTSSRAFSWACREEGIKLIWRPAVPKTVAKWVARFEAEGGVGLRDRSSKPCSSPSQIPPATADAVEALRRQRHTQEHIAGEFGISKATVSRILKRRRPEPALGARAGRAGPPLRARRPGELDPPRHQKARHASIASATASPATGRPEQRRRGVGWEFVHVAIDDASRLAFSRRSCPTREGKRRRLPQGRRRLLRSLGVTVERVMTDNGSCYRSHRLPPGLPRLGIKHIRTRPYTPRTNGKAERFIQTSLREWAYARAYTTSDTRRRTARSGSTATTGTGRMPASDQTTHQQTRPNQEQPLEAPQLGRLPRRPPQPARRGQAGGLGFCPRTAAAVGN